MVAAINLQPTLAPQMVQVLSLAQAAVGVQEASMLLGQKVVPGVVTPKVAVVREVLHPPRQAAQAHHAIMVAVMAVVVVGGPALSHRVSVAQEATQAEAGAAVLVAMSALQPQAEKAATALSEFIVGR